MIVNNNFTYASQRAAFKASLIDLTLKNTQNVSTPMSTPTAPVAVQYSQQAAYPIVNAPSVAALNKQLAPSLFVMTIAQMAQNMNQTTTVPVQRVNTELQTPKLPGYKNNLRSMFQNNQVVIYAMVPRIFNAKDKDGNRLIEDGEEKGTFINMIERFDELKAYGVNTLHWLPINQPGLIAQKGSAGSVYAPLDYLSIDPRLDDPNNPKSVKEEAKEAINEAHKRGIKVMLDLPSCMSVDLYDARPDMRATDAQGKPKTPEGWEDIRMFEPWKDADKRILNPELLQYHKDFIDMCIDLGIDGIRADVARAKPAEFWDQLIPYARSKDPEFAFLAESYVYEDASPIKNMPADRPEELLEAGFDSYYGQYHIFPIWKAKDFHQFVKENLTMSHKYEKGKSLIGSFGTHDDESAMANGGADYCMMTSVVQTTLPMTNPYIISGFETGDEYLYPFNKKYVNKTFNELMQNPVYKTVTDQIVANKELPENASFTKLVNSSDANLKIEELSKKSEYEDVLNFFKTYEYTRDNITYYLSREKLDIFNESGRPEGEHPEIGKHFATLMNVMRKEHENIITKGSYIELPVENNKRDEVVAYARHYQGKTLVTIANKDVNSRQEVTVKIPGMKASQVLTDLSPEYGLPSHYQALDGAIKIDLGKARGHIFEIDVPNLEQYFKPEDVYRQNL